MRKLMLGVLAAVAIATTAGCSACSDGSSGTWGGTMYRACPMNVFQRDCCAPGNLETYGCKCSATCPCWRRHK